MSRTRGFVTRSSEPEAEGAAARFPRERRWRAPDAKAAEVETPPGALKFGIDLSRVPLYPPGDPRREAGPPWLRGPARSGAAMGVAGDEKKREDAAPEMEPTASRAPSRQPPASAAFGTTRGLLQAKLAVGSVEDPLEKEADRAAETTLGGEGLSRITSSAPVLSRMCGECGKRDEEKGAQVQRRVSPGAVVEGTSEAPPIVEEVLRGSGGRPLDDKTRAFFEHRLEHDLGRVRVHTGSKAAESARAVGALAYTVGQDIVFGEGQYQPGHEIGRRLIAHEVAHTLQQEHAPARAGAGVVVQRQPAPAQPAPQENEPAAPGPNPAQYRYVPFNADGTWEATTILDQISQREKTETRTFQPLPGAGKESDPARCGANATMAVAINAGPKAVVQLCINLGKRINDYAERARGAPPNTMLSAEVIDRARTEIFNIARNVQFCSQNGAREGSACTLTFADFDRLANWLYHFTYNENDEGRQMAREGKDPEGQLAGGRARYRTDKEIGNSAQMAGYPRIDREHKITDERILDLYLAKLEPGKSLLAMWGVHTYAFLRDAGDGKIYLYTSWPRLDKPDEGQRVLVKGSEGYEKLVKEGIENRDKPMVLLVQNGFLFSFFG